MSSFDRTSIMRRVTNDQGQSRGDTTRVLQLYRRRREWDAGFELLRVHGLDDELAGLVLDAIDETLARARLSTLETWVRFAHARSQSLHPVLLVAEMELQLRHGRHTTALMTAKSMLADGRLETEMRYRVLL